MSSTNRSIEAAATLRNHLDQFTGEPAPFRHAKLIIEVAKNSWYPEEHYAAAAYGAQLCAAARLLQLQPLGAVLDGTNLILFPKVAKNDQLQCVLLDIGGSPVPADYFEWGASEILEQAHQLTQAIENRTFRMVSSEEFAEQLSDDDEIYKWCEPAEPATDGTKWTKSELELDHEIPGIVASRLSHQPSGDRVWRGLPARVLRRVLLWNDPNGDYEEYEESDFESWCEVTASQSPEYPGQTASAVGRELFERFAKAHAAN